ncbi:hypothetical protein CEXT_109351 [Caerostris extrusa]|uniref:Uncharacterized protein n=1 Tax=Caerostris extrusa TaxID=172846 RepID=A0AAV4XDM9_CAEEX|nr:hypothetical protein CEXT_109351 [Caerostris extrusa]
MGSSTTMKTMQICFLTDGIHCNGCRLKPQIGWVVLPNFAGSATFVTLIIIPFSKSESSGTRGILHATNADAVSYTIYTGGVRDVPQDRRYRHLHRCPNTYW